MGHQHVELDIHWQCSKLDIIEETWASGKGSQSATKKNGQDPEYAVCDAHSLVSQDSQVRIKDTTAMLWKKNHDKTVHQCNVLEVLQQLDPSWSRCVQGRSIQRPFRVLMCMFTHLRWFSSLQVCLKITIHMGLKKSMTVRGLFLVSWTYLLLQLSQGICRLQQQSLHRSSSTIFLCEILDLNYWQNLHIYIIITPAKLMWAIILIFSNSEHTMFGISLLPPLWFMQFLRN